LGTDVPLPDATGHISTLHVWCSAQITVAYY
jgi:hypothetical protein